MNHIPNHATSPSRLRKHTNNNPNKNRRKNTPETAVDGGGGGGSDVLRVAGFRRLGVDAHLLAAVGEWSSCTSDCTHTRKVVCTTLDYKIVPDHLCADELPPATEICDTDACTSGSEEKGVTDSAGAGGSKNNKDGEGEHQEDMVVRGTAPPQSAGDVEAVSPSPEVYEGAVGSGGGIGAVEAADEVPAKAKAVAGRTSGGEGKSKPHLGQRVSKRRRLLAKDYI